jgi:hypothetical protein
MNHIDSSETTPSRIGRQRSPSYPNISLPEAISLAHRIVDVAMSNPIAEDELAQRLGYEAGSSWLGLRLSALSKFGLLEIIPASPTRGKMCELTGLAERLMRWNSQKDDYKVALRQAALRPPIYNDLWTRFGPELPTDAEMAAYLVGERKFNPNVVSSVLADFRATAECADLKSMPMPKPQVDAATLDAYSRIRTQAQAILRNATGQTHFVLGQPFATGGPTADELRRVLEQKFENPDQRTTAIPLADGETATITMPKKMSPQSWQMLLDTLELWKKQASEA